MLAHVRKDPAGFPTPPAVMHCIGTTQRFQRQTFDDVTRWNFRQSRQPCGAVSILHAAPCRSCIVGFAPAVLAIVGRRVTAREARGLGKQSFHVRLIG